MANGENYLLKILKDYWFIAIAISSIIISWTTLNGRVNVVEKNFMEQCIKTEKRQVDIQESQLEIAAIKRDLIYLKERADKTEELSYLILKEIRK